MKLKLLFIPRFHADPNDYRAINPPHFAPLGIATLTSYLRNHNYRVEQDDLDIKTWYYNARHTTKNINLKQFMNEEKIERFYVTAEDADLEAEAEKILKLTNLKGFEVVGFSLMPTDNPSTGGVALALAKVLKQKYDPVIIIGGSVNGEVEYKLLKTGYVDFRVRGHPGSSVGEKNLLNFLNKLDKNLSREKIKGINYVKNGKPIGDDPKYSFEDEFSVTTPCFDGLPMELYRKDFTYEIEGKEYKLKILVIPYFFIKGCPNACAFCSHAVKDGWYGKDLELVAAELKEFSKKYKTQYFYFHNSTINPTYDYAEQFSNALIDNDAHIFWSDCANLNPLDEKLIKKLKESGSVRMVFGFEGASQPVLNYIHKNFTVPHAEKILGLCHKNNVWAELDMICGFPYENETDIDRTIHFIHKNRKYIKACSLNKFWLEGTFMTQPEKYYIRTHIDDCETHINWAVRGFDEIYGLKWPDKLKQINKCYNTLQSVVNKNFKPAPDIHNLFFDFALNHDNLWKSIYNGKRNS